MAEITIQETTPDTKIIPPKNVPLPPSPPPQHPATQSFTMPGGLNDDKGKAKMTGNTDMNDVGTTGPPPGPSGPAHNTSNRAGPSFLSRTFSTQNRASYKRFFSAYAQTWLGLSPLWLMGEAVIPGAHVGSQFNKGRKKLVDAAEEVRKAVASGAKDVVVIVDEKFRMGLKGGKDGKDGEGDGRKMVERTAEVIKAAGENAILVVTTSLEKLSTSLDSQKSKTHGKNNSTTIDLRALASSPALRASVKKHGRDALVLLDDALHHPVVVTGVAEFARTRGIPHADALLRLASLGLQKILKAIPLEEAHEAADHVEAHIEELDAEELERQSTQEERAESVRFGEAARDSPDPRVEGKGPKDDEDPYEALRRKSQCTVM